MSADQRSQYALLIERPESFFDSESAGMRRLAVAAAQGRPDLLDRVAAMLSSDPDSSVRRECAETLGLSGWKKASVLEAAIGDEASEVREAAVTALGELAQPSAVPVLIQCATAEDEDRLVREAAVAALGAIADPQGLPVLLDLVASAPPQIRRRCVAALTVFEGPEVEAAIRAAAQDRNPMVREAAEMVVGRATDD